MWLTLKTRSRTLLSPPFPRNFVARTSGTFTINSLKLVLVISGNSFPRPLKKTLQVRAASRKVQRPPKGNLAKREKLRKFTQGAKNSIASCSLEDREANDRMNAGLPHSLPTPSGAKPNSHEPEFEGGQSSSLSVLYTSDRPSAFLPSAHSSTCLVACQSMSTRSNSLTVSIFSNLENRPITLPCTPMLIWQHLSLPDIMEALSSPPPPFTSFSSGG